MNFLWLFPLVLGLLLITAGGCSREYSFEGRDTTTPPVIEPLPDDSLPPADSAVFPNLGSCPECVGPLGKETWTLVVGGARLCGTIDTAIVNKERNAFTFFGPSACSKDSGLIISVWLEPEQLNRNRQNLSTEKVSLYYYDNLNGPYMLQTRQDQPFRFTILEYDHQNRLASGSFSGAAFTEEGKEIKVREGKWSTFLH